MTKQLSPNPDYRSGLPEDQLCGCEESEHLYAELGAAHVRIAEQAAVIERVRAYAEEYVGDGRLIWPRAVIGALAAAPEATDTDWKEAYEQAQAEVVQRRYDLAAANARVAELERLHEQALSERDAAHLSLESMTAGRDSALELAADISDQRDAAEARVRELETALAAAERDWKRDAEALAVNETTRAEAAEARVRELEAELAATHREYDRAIAAADMPSGGTKAALLEACRVDLRRAVRRG